MIPGPDTRLARLLSARLCHDLGGAVGSLAGALDLLPEHGDELLEVAKDSAISLRLRMRLYAAAWGGPTIAMEPAALETLLGGAPAAPRVRFDLSDLAPGVPLPAPIVPIALNAALLAAEALPRGGTVRLAGDGDSGLLVLPVADIGHSPAAWAPRWVALLAGGSPDAALAEGPRAVLAPLLHALLAEAGWTAAFGLGAGHAAQPLMLTPG